MKNKMGIIITSHGDFAKEALNSVEMIQGKLANVKAISLFPGMNLNDFVLEIEKGVQELDTTKGLLILSDIFGGTPSNAAAMILMKHQRQDFYAFAGFNLGILLELSNLQNKDSSYAIEQVEKLMPYSWKQIKIQKNIIEKVEGL